TSGGASAGGTAGNPSVAGASGVSGGTGGAPTLKAGAWGDQGTGTFKNPVLWADYNNLDVTDARGEFYMIAASHHFMGMPVLRSRDMVNWRLVSRIYRRLDLHARYDQPGQAYQHGTWAPAIRHHENRFYVYVATPREGLLMTTAADAAGPWEPWTLVRAVENWEDPCPFWDDLDGAGGDGPNGRKAYLVRSRLGAGPLIVQEMSWDGKRLIGPETTVATGPTLEGPKLHKRAGYYYIFAPEGGIDNGYQVVLRSRAILGPYEKRTILQRGTTAINGPHQGSWIDLPSGESWFYHFQQNQGWGRIAHLQPARWGADGWPAIGVDLDANGIGEPVAQPRKPNVGADFPLDVPQSSDEFDGPALGLQWLWNHNPDDEKWSLAARPGWLRLTAQPLLARSGQDGATGAAVPFREDSIVFARNTLVQLAMGRVASAVAELDTSGMIDGQRAGVTLFGQAYGWVGAVREAGQTSVRANVNGVYSSGPALSSSRVFLQARMSAASEISFAYSLDGATFTPLGASRVVGRTWFEGIKFGVFTYNPSSGPAGGNADFNYFRYTHDGPR
ncbi:MAG TPA: glycoside hydrolase 43 family protein, partial [Polyangiaceae bacterium]|nr:glycoside hydrolase 43 family protein [Polyangiaceae bacterium]